MVEWFDDLKVGMRFKSEAITVSKDDIIRFAREYDPQPFHLDEEAAKKSILGGLAASGWHTSAMFMRMMADSFVLNSLCEGAPGVDFMEWRKPVLAGDTLSGHSTVLEARPMRSRPGLGIVKFRHEVENQRGELVLLSENSVIFGMRGSLEVSA